MARDRTSLIVSLQDVDDLMSSVKSSLELCMVTSPTAFEKIEVFQRLQQLQRRLRAARERLTEDRLGRGGSVRPDGPETAKGGLVGQEPY